MVGAKSHWIAAVAQFGFIVSAWGATFGLAGTTDGLWLVDTWFPDQ